MKNIYNFVEKLFLLYLKISEDLRNISPDLKLYTNGDTMITSNVIEFLKTLDSVNVSVGSCN